MNRYAIMALLLILAPAAIAATTTTFTADSTYVVPTNVTKIYIEAWGGGGAGQQSGNTETASQAGGGGGAYAASLITVTPGQNYTVNVGEGGTSITVAAGGTGVAINGNASNVSISGTTQVFAAAGTSAISCASIGVGGTAAASTGTVKFSGGNGGLGNCGLGTGSGAGGGGAGTQANGGNGSSGASGGAAGTGGSIGGGNGGAGTAAGDANGNAGSTIGGGGSGSYCDGGCGNVRNGGAGARGEIRITEFYNNSILIYLYDEATSAIITGTNISIAATSDAYITSTTTTTGFAAFDNLADGNYTLSFTSGTYSQRQYVVTVANNSAQTINAYLTNSSATTVLLVTAANGPDAGQPVPGAIATWEAIINGSFTTIESRLTDISGTAGPFPYITTSMYRITISADNFVSKQFILNPVQYSSYNILLVSTTSFENPQDYDGTSIVFTPSTYLNAAQNNFTFIISHPSGNLTSYNYTIVYPTGTVSNSGSNAYGSTLTSQFNITGATVTSTVDLTFCYTTPVTGMRCFTRSYPVQGQYGNYTISSAASASTTMGDLEKIIIATLGTAIFVGTAGLTAGPLAAGAVWLLSMGLFYKILAFNIWLLIIPGIVGFLALAFGSGRQ